MLKQKYQFKNYNWVLIGAVLILSGMGVLFINSADSSYTSKQLVGLIFCTGVMLFLSVVNFNFVCGFNRVLYMINIVLLVLVKLVGVSVNGAQRWINLGFTRLQPSELTKIIMIIFVAVYIQEYDNYLFFPAVRDFPSDTTDIDEFPFEKDDLTYLFSVDDAHYFLLEKEPAYLPEGYDFAPVRKLRTKEVHPKYRIFTGITGFQLSNWYKNNRFCGRCGSKTVHSTTERALKCPSCGHVIYPRIVPAVIVGVCNGDEILVTKYRTGFAHYALVAGFTEIGETLEETVQREVMEETGLHVKNIRYYKSQPWGIVDDILAGFYCDVDGDTEIQMDESELKLAEWKKREDIVLQPDDFSLTNEMMLMFKKGKQ